MKLNRIKLNYVLLVCALCAAIFITYGRSGLVFPPAGPLVLLPAQMGEWHMTGETLFDEATLKVLRPADYLMRLYADTQGRHIGLYIGYHDGSPDTGPIHSPRNCLPGSGWALLGGSEVDMETPGGPLRLMRAVYAKDAERVLYYYWYQVRGESVTGDFELKFREARGVLLDRRRDAAFIRLHMPDMPAAEADALVESFLSNAYPAIRRLLPSA